MKAGAGIVATGLLIDKTFDKTWQYFTEAGSAMANMAARTGLSVEQLSALSYAAEQAGLDSEGLAHGIRHMQREIAAAAGGSKEAQQTFATLGVAVSDLASVDATQQLADLADTLGKIQNPTQQAALAMKVFGREGAAMVPLLKGGSAGLNEMFDKAKSLGLIMSTEDAVAARDFNRECKTLTASLKMLVFQIGSALMPAARQIRAAIQPVVTKAIEWVKANTGLIVSISKVGLALAGAGVAIAAIGGALSIVGAVVGKLTLIAGVAAAVVAPLGLIGTVAAATGAYLLYTTGAGGKAMKWLGATFSDVAETAVETWGGIVDAIQSGDIGLAAQIAAKGLELGFSQVWHKLKGGFADLKANFIDTMSDMVLSSKFLTNSLLTWGELIDKILNKIGLLSDEDLAKHKGAADVIRGMSDEQRKELQRLIKRRAFDEAAGVHDEDRADEARLRGELANLRGKVKPRAPLDLGKFGGGISPFEVLQKAEVMGTFSAAAAGRIGFGQSLQQRMANGIDEIAANTRGLKDGPGIPIV
jgi:hypothetical protein